MHDYHHHHEVTGKNLSVSIVLNVGITAAQIVGGMISGSLSLLSDALHNLSDVVSLVLSLVAHRLSKKKATPAQTFGYKRAELLAAFVNAAALILVAGYLIYEAVGRWNSPTPIASGLVIVLSLLGIIFNGISTFLLKEDARHNVNMKSAYLHLLTDTLASVAVLTGGLLMYFFAWYWVDAALTIAIAVYLIIMGWGLLKSTSRMLLLFTPDHLDIEKIAARLHTVTRANRLHHIHLWPLNDHVWHFEAHLHCHQNMTIAEFGQIVRAVEQLLHDEFHITHSTIQPEFGPDCPTGFIAQE